MSVFTFFRPVLHALSDGPIIRKSIAIVLQVLSVLGVLSGIYTVIEILKASFRLPTEGTIGGLILAIVVAVAVLAIVQVLLCRAQDVVSLETSPFTVIPICSILLRACGETYAILGVAVGLGGCLFIWLSGIHPFFILGAMAGLFPQVSFGNSFLGGVVFLLSLLLLSFFGLLLFYFLAESVIVMVDIAKSMRTVVRQTESGH